jgi:hypothetical protein
MKRLALLLLPAALFAGQPRYARLGEFEGPVEVQLQAADAWMPAERNLPLPELAWIRTGPAAHVEIELDDGSVWRLGPESQGELSDYARLSTGQRVTLLSLDHGLAYFTGKPGADDSLSLAVPGAQAILLRAARLRLEAQTAWSQISVLEGSARFSSPTAEIELPQGLYARVEPGNRERFFLERKIPALDPDRWSADRDRALASTTSQAHVIARYGVADLDTAGTWIHTDQFGPVWKPKVAENWTPFQKGRWRWYDTLGYTWVSDDPWGWLPYHYGRWAISATLGWVWAPSMSQVFEPGEVYWLHGAKLAGWGPLAPGEHWTPTGPPELFANLYMTFAALAPDARVIDPAGFTARPDEPLGAAVFAVALPSPSFPASRLEAVRPLLQAGSTRLKPVLPGVTYGTDPEPVEQPPAAPPPTEPDRSSEPPQPAMTVLNPASGLTPVLAPEAPPDPAVVAYPVPVLAGVLAITAPQPAAVPAEAKTTATTPKSSTSTASTSTTSSTASGSTSKSGGGRPPETKKPPKPAEPAGSHPSTSPSHEPRARELEIYNRILQDGNEPVKLLEDLDTWAREFPRSPYVDERSALYVQAYASLKPPQSAKALDLGAQLMERNLQSLFPDPQRGPALILGVLYSMTVSSWSLPRATSQQRQSALAAARQLLEYSPAYFTSSRRPAGMTADSWRQTRDAIETAAHQTVALLGPGSVAPAKAPGVRN